MMDMFTVKQWLFLILLAMIVCGVLLWRLNRRCSTLMDDNVFIAKQLKKLTGDM